MTKSITGLLEAMIDAHGLQHILTGLECVCQEKAEHIRCNWQDNKTARVWDTAAKRIYSIAAKTDI